MFNKTPKNIAGKFFIDLLGQKREMVINFGFCERVEKFTIGKALVTLLAESISGNPMLTDVVSFVDEALRNNGDTRLKREQIGQAVFERGVHNFLKVYQDMLVYALNGKDDIELVKTAPDEDKKK